MQVEAESRRIRRPKTREMGPREKRFHRLPDPKAEGETVGGGWRMWRRQCKKKRKHRGGFDRMQGMEQKK